MKRHSSTIGLVLIFLFGLILLLYPSFSDWWNQFHQSRAVVSYAETVATIDNPAYERMYTEAVEYNERLKESEIHWILTPEEMDEYNNTLCVTESGIMSYIEIPAINVMLPVYHGTEGTILQVAIGHLAGTSLPVGGESTHCVLSGHRGLPSARLFTDLDKLVKGDIFFIRTLDEVLTYEVDQIRIVEPTDLSDIVIVEGQDYCTLVTCTPYGINTHRLLVRGHRVETVTNATVRVVADALQVGTAIVALFIAIPILLVLMIIVLLTSGRSKKRA